MHFLALFVSSVVIAQTIANNKTKPDENPAAPGISTTTNSQDSAVSDSDCILCSSGVIDWISPPLFRDPNPYPVGKPISFQWKYRDVEILPSNVGIELIGADNIARVIAANYTVGGSEIMFEWTPQNLATFKAYKLVIYDGRVGKDKVVPGRMRTSMSPPFGIYNPSNGGGDLWSVGTISAVAGGSSLVFLFAFFFLI